MSQASNHVKYCLNKAKKEITGGKKHRGLVDIKPDISKAGLHIEKAEHNFNAISYFDEGGFSDWSVSAAFYTIYHCFLAILAKHGYESRNQDCTMAAIQFLKEESKIQLGDKFAVALKYHAEIEERHEDTVIELR